MTELQAGQGLPETAVVAELPQFRSRVQDYLNNDLQFLAFGFKGTRLFVNKTKISRITFQ